MERIGVRVLFCYFVERPFIFLIDLVGTDSQFLFVSSGWCKIHLDEFSLINGITQFGFPEKGGVTLFYKDEGVYEEDKVKHAYKNVPQEIGIPHVNGRCTLARFNTALHAASDWGPGGRLVIGCYTDIRTCRCFLKYDLVEFNNDFRKVKMKPVSEAEFQKRTAQFNAAVAQANK